MSERLPARTRALSLSLTRRATAGQPCSRAARPCVRRRRPATIAVRLVQARPRARARSRPPLHEDAARHVLVAVHVDGRRFPRRIDIVAHVAHPIVLRALVFEPFHVVIALVGDDGVHVVVAVDVGSDDRQRAASVRVEHVFGKVRGPVVFPPRHDGVAVGARKYIDVVVSVDVERTRVEQAVSRARHDVLGGKCAGAVRVFVPREGVPVVCRNHHVRVAVLVYVHGKHVLRIVRARERLTRAPGHDVARRRGPRRRRGHRRHRRERGRGRGVARRSRRRGRVVGGHGRGLRRRCRPGRECGLRGPALVLEPGNLVVGKVGHQRVDVAVAVDVGGVYAIARVDAADPVLDEQRHSVVLVPKHVVRVARGRE